MAGKSTTTEISISGMSCGSCVRHVTDALRGVPGVTEARVELQAGRAVVVHDPASTVPESLLQAVEEAGYAAELSFPGPTAAG